MGLSLAELRITQILSAHLEGSPLSVMGPPRALPARSRDLNSSLYFIEACSGDVRLRRMASTCLLCKDQVCHPHTFIGSSGE